MRTNCYGGGKRPFFTDLAPTLSLSAPVMLEISTLPALFLSNPRWGNLGLLSRVTSICTWFSSWVHSSGKNWLLRSQWEESARSKSSAWGWRKWKMENMLSLEASHSFGKFWNLHWFVVRRLPSVFLVSNRRFPLWISIWITYEFYVMPLLSKAKLPGKVELEFWHNVFVCCLSQRDHSQFTMRKWRIGYSICPLLLNLFIIQNF